MSTEFLSGIIKGDSIVFECNAGENITGWKIRAELYDEGSVDIKKASTNSGGSDSQAKITDAANGLFEVYIDKLQTTNINDTANLEIEIETSLGKVYTIYQNLIKFSDEKITWSTP